MKSSIHQMAFNRVKADDPDFYYSDGQFLEDQRVKARDGYNAQGTDGCRKDVTILLKPLFGISSIDSDATAHFHVTASYLGDATDETFSAIAELSLRVPTSSAITMKVTGTAMFGPKANIPVLLVGFEDGLHQKVFDEFHRSHGVCEPGMPRKLDTPNYHINCKGSESLSKLPVGTKFVIKSISAKRLGPVDPFWTFRL